MIVIVVTIIIIITNSIIAHLEVGMAALTNYLWLYCVCRFRSIYFRFHAKSASLACASEAVIGQAFLA